MPTLRGLTRPLCIASRRRARLISPSPASKMVVHTEFGSIRPAAEPGVGDRAGRRDEWGKAERWRRSTRRISASTSRRRGPRRRRSGGGSSWSCSCSARGAHRLRRALRGRRPATPGRRAGRGRRRRPWPSSTRPGSSPGPPRCSGWRRPPSRRPWSTCNRSGTAATARGCRPPGLGGNPMRPSLRGAELGSGVIIDKAEGLHRHQLPRRQGRRPDHRPARPGRRRPGPARRRRPQDRPRRAPDQGRRSRVQAEWGDSDKLDIGDWVLAIGSPLGFDHSVTAGIVSATERNDCADRRVRVVHPDRRRDQPRQLGRAADRPDGQGRRHQYRDHHPDRRLRGDRPGDPLVAGQAGRRGADQGRARSSAATSACSIHSLDRGRRPQSSSCPDNRGRHDRRRPARQPRRRGRPEDAAT